VYRKPASLSTLYAHPIENIVFNVGILIGAIHWFHLSHTLTHIYAAFISFFAVTAHSGPLKWGGFQYFSRHDYHHLYMNCEYGPGLFMDRLCKTRKEDLVTQ
jgi:hypothetical protein